MGEDRDDLNDERESFFDRKSIFDDIDSDDDLAKEIEDYIATNKPAYSEEQLSSDSEFIMEDTSEDEGFVSVNIADEADEVIEKEEVSEESIEISTDSEIEQKQDKKVKDKKIKDKKEKKTKSEKKAEKKALAEEKQAVKESKKRDKKKAKKKPSKVVGVLVGILVAAVVGFCTYVLGLSQGSGVGIADLLNSEVEIGATDDTAPKLESDMLVVEESEVVDEETVADENITVLTLDQRDYIRNVLTILGVDLVQFKNIRETKTYTYDTAEVDTYTKLFHIGDNIMRATNGRALCEIMPPSEGDEEFNCYDVKIVEAWMKNLFNVDNTTLCDHEYTKDGILKLPIDYDYVNSVMSDVEGVKSHLDGALDVTSQVSVSGTEMERIFIKVTFTLVPNEVSPCGYTMKNIACDVL